MNWQHYEHRATGAATLVNDGGSNVPATYEMGTVSTGRSRVFAGYFVRLMLEDGGKFSGEDQHSLRVALRKLASSLSTVMLELQCVGLDPRWKETGLSVDSGAGYFGEEAIPTHMMDTVPIGADKGIDRLIAEATGTLRIGIQRP